jgi:hypothetical protein
MLSAEAQLIAAVCIAPHTALQWSGPALVSYAAVVVLLSMVDTSAASSRCAVKVAVCAPFALVFTGSHAYVAVAYGVATAAECVLWPTLLFHRRK